MDGVSILAEVSESASAAMAYGKSGAIGRIEVFNNTTRPIDVLTVTTKSDPPVFKECSYDIGSLNPGESAEIVPHDCFFDADFLMDATAGIGKVLIDAHSESGIIASFVSNITILPADDAPGEDDAMYFSAHVDPRSPLVEELIAELETVGVKMPKNGYVDMSRVNVRALFDALSDIVSKRFSNISGAKIRPSEEIAESSGCNPWESVALRCSVFERLGLHPIAVVSNGTPGCGLWLYEGSLSSEVVYEPDVIAMNTEEGYIAIDPVSLSAEDFSYAVDIEKSRRLVQPMGKGPEVEWEPKTEKQYSKKEQWERKLLDISFRNNLINMRRTARVVPLMIGDISRFYESVASGRELELIPKPEVWSGADVFEKYPMEPGRFTENAFRTVTDAVGEMKATLPLAEGALRTAAASLYRTSKKELEENGSNSFYIGLGALRWYDASSPDITRYSPLVLVPASIERKRGRGYVIKAIDEDTIFNITLSEKLRGEYGIDLQAVDSLPTRQDGTIDINSVFTAVRTAIKPMREWEVIQTTVLGIFSFNQFVMWRDITLFPDLEKNKIVKSLMESKLSWQATPVEDLSEPYDVCLTLPADSSQIRAIRASGEGKSFVLHGPPGTGKSQTITNIISNALFDGKTVLFVAEKMAALEVVQKRLEEIGIGNYCLELHSNKAERGKVMEQLRSSMEKCRPTDGEEYERKTRRLLDAKVTLDRYAESLHKKLPCGLSVHDAISRYEAHASSLTFDIYIDQSIVSNTTIDDFDDWEYHVTKMSRSRGIFNNKPDNPFLLIGTADVTVGSAERAKPLLQRLVEVSRKLIRVNDKIKALYLPGNISNSSDVKLIEEFSESMDRGLLENPGLVSIPRASKAVLDELKKSDAFIASLARVSEMGISSNANAATDIKNTLSDAMEKLRALGCDLPIPAARSRLDDLAYIEGVATSADESVRLILKNWKPLVFDLNREVDLATCWRQANGAGFFKKRKAAKNFMENYGFALIDPTVKFKNVPNVLKSLTELASSVERVRSIVSDSLNGPVAAALSADVTALTEFERKVKDHLEMIELCGGKPEGVADAMAKITANPGLSSEITTTLLEYEEAYAAVRDHLTLTEQLETPEESLWFSNAILENIGKLPDWTLWNLQCREAYSMGLGAVIDAINAGGDPELLPASFSKALYKAVAEDGISRFPELSEFRSDGFEADVTEFRKMDSEYMELNREILRHRLRERVPSRLDQSIDGSEANILYRAINTQRSRKSIRTLFSEIPNLLLRMCLCMLMSPLSVAQYLSPEFPKFDIVVFDEASQIPTHKAIGSLARCESAIIVGDPKQLPPTTFFESTIEMDVEFEELEDMDSLLEDCLALPMPESYLEWHYRSRHESLIAFSNNVYYGNRMLTFPSPNDAETKVSFHLVDGVYDRGGKRTNTVEAEAVVEEAIRYLAEGKQSVGIVAFSKAQQEKIDDLLWARLDKDDDLYFEAVNGREPLFVKNLENVQGDERDVILFSVGYGPDASGKVSINFGPINKPGGGRRLNVAVSRARYEMAVFSSMKGEQIRIGPSTPDGVRQLRRFLEFAQNGGRFGPTDGKAVRTEGSPMAARIAAALAEKGFETRFDVGGSGFKIDVAVIDPDNKNRYILGIMSDGERYRDSGNTRDREFAREEVLKGLGWNIFRVWSIEWMYNHEEVVERICAAIADADRVPDITAEVDCVTYPTEVNHLMPSEEDDKYEIMPEEEFRKTYERVKIEPRTSAFEDDIRKRINIINLANGILREEAPVTESYLVQRIADAYPGTRLTQKNRKAIISIIAGVCGNVTYFGEEKTYWDRHQDPSEYFTFRVPPKGEVRREIEQIPVEEIANAVVNLVDKSVSVDIKNLVTSVSREFGFRRIGPKIEEVINHGIKFAEVQGRIILDEERAYASDL